MITTNDIINLKNYFYSSISPDINSEQSESLIDLEMGNTSLHETPKREVLPGSVRITAKEIFESERTKLVDPAQAPGTAAGESKYFMPRQLFLLKEKYQDREGQTIRVIGNVVYQNLLKSEPSEGVPSIIDINTAGDLGILSGKEASLISKIDRTTTKMGKSYLQLLIARPTADIRLLQDRQNLIKTLIEDSNLFEGLRDDLNKMGENEVPLLSCWDSEKQLPGSTAGLYYRLNSQLNTRLNSSSLALDINAVCITAKKAINTVMMGVSGIALAAFAACEAVRASTSSDTPESLREYSEHSIGATPASWPGIISLTVDSPTVHVVSAAYASFMCLSSLENTYGWMKADTAMLPLMQDILSSVATHYKCIKSIYNQLKDKPQIRGALEHFSHIEDFITNKEAVEDLETLFNLLESFSFNEGNTYCFRPGEILLAWELLHSSSFKKRKKDKASDSKPADQDEPRALASGDKIRAAFEKIIPAIGELDAFLSTAKLMIESEEGGEGKPKYSFPTYIERASKPSLSSQGIWNPRIDRARAVPNNISIGENGLNGLVITGPNTGGKSCFALSIEAAAAMAQSLSIAPCDKMEFTPFDYMRTSMDVRGSIQEEESLFAAQSRSIGKIQEGVKELAKARGFSLTILDEPLSGTNAEAGKNLVLGVAKDLVETSGNLSVIITHFSEVAVKLNDKECCYEAYQIKEDGSYTLQKGIYSGSNAFETAENYGISTHSLLVAKANYQQKV